MYFNRFNNVNTGVNVPIAMGSYTWGVNSYTGTLSSNLTIAQNYFGAQLTNTTSITNQFMSTAIAVTGPGAYSTWNSTSNGLQLNNNTINRAYRGIYVNESRFSNPAVIKDNTIVLVNDGQFSTAQYGVNVSSCIYHFVQTNTISAANTTNTLVSLVYSGANSNHNVVCNTLSTAYQGFVFDGPHTGTNNWKGNKMQTLQRGMVLKNNGQIGQQGSNGNPIDNQWNGSGWTGSNNGTYVDNSSDAQYSKLWVRSSGGVYTPPNPGGPNAALSYAAVGNVSTTATGAYSCGGGGGGGGARLMSFGSENAGENLINDNMARLSNSSELNETEYIEATANYRFLMQNDSIRQSDTVFQAFCDALVGTSIEKFYQADEYLKSASFNDAKAISESVIATNNVESSYKLFYDLNFKVHSNTFTESDNTSLYELANRCPGIDGEAINYARSLYNAIFAVIHKFNDNCNVNSLARTIQVPTSNKNSSNIVIFPNPAANYFNLSAEDGVYTLIIKDISDKLVFESVIKVKNNNANLNIDLKNGLYLVTISNNKHESQTKKLVITR